MPNAKTKIKSVARFLCALVTASFAARALCAYEAVVYNELGSGIAGKEAEESSATRFAGVYDEVYGRILTGKLCVEARYRMSLGASSIASLTESDSDRLRANVWFFPANGIELVLGNDYYLCVPASYMIVADDYAGNGRYGRDGAGFCVTALEDFSAGISLPSEQSLDKDNFQMKINAGAHFTFAQKVNVGATFIGTINGKQGCGVYASFNGSNLIYVGGGYSYRGYSAFKDVNEDERIYSDHYANLTFKIGSGLFSLSGDFEIGFNASSRTPLYAGLQPAIIVDNDAYIEFDLQWQNTGIASDTSDNSFIVYPHVSYFHPTLGKFGAGFKLRLNGGTSSNGAYYPGFTIPIYWRYYF